ncbi:MAG: type sorting protein [Ferruginibacter sp.]|nr:type sorting protein [Ferruginibacter sp.]
MKANTAAAICANRNSTVYRWVDANPVGGNNFYGIRNVSLDGSVEYSSFVVLKMGEMASGIRIFPNPVENGIVGAEFKNMLAGVYNINLVNSAGQTMLSKTLLHAPGASREYIEPANKMAPGTYQIKSYHTR